MLLQETIDAKEARANSSKINTDYKELVIKLKKEITLHETAYKVMSTSWNEVNTNLSKVKKELAGKDAAINKLLSDDTINSSFIVKGTSTGRISFPVMTLEELMSHVVKKD